MSRRGYGPALRLVQTAPRAKPGALPPHDLAAEAAVISACMLDVQALRTVAPVLKAEHFYSRENELVFEAILAIHERGQPVDTVTISAELRASGKLQAAGGAAYLAEICDATPAVSNVLSHARIVAECRAMRDVIATCQTIEAEGYGDVADRSAWVRAAAARLEPTVDVVEEAPAYLGDAVGTVIERTRRDVERARALDTNVTGIPWGLRELDEATGGMHIPETLVVTAPPGGGKSAFAMGRAYVTATSPREWQEPDGSWRTRYRGVVVFGMEMKREQYLRRIACGISRVDSKRLRNGRATDDELARFFAALESVRDLPILVDDTKRGQTFARIEARMRAAKAYLKRGGIELALAVIDYVQLIETADASGDDDGRARALDVGTRRLRGLGDELGIAQLWLSQTNQEGRTKGAGAVDEHTDNRLDISLKGDDEDPEREARIKIKKGREGGRATVSCWFSGAYTLFHD